MLPAVPIFSSKPNTISNWQYCQFVNIATHFDSFTCDMERVCIPRSLGPPEAMVEHVELCREGPAIAGRLVPLKAAISSGSQ